MRTYRFIRCWCTIAGLRFEPAQIESTTPIRFDTIGSRRFPTGTPRQEFALGMEGVWDAPVDQLDRSLSTDDWMLKLLLEWTRVIRRFGGEDVVVAYLVEHENDCIVEIPPDVLTRLGALGIRLAIGYQRSLRWGDEDSAELVMPEQDGEE